MSEDTSSKSSFANKAFRPKDDSQCTICGGKDAMHQTQDEEGIVILSACEDCFLVVVTDGKAIPSMPSTPAFPHIPNNTSPAEGPIISGTPMTATTTVVIGTGSVNQCENVVAEQPPRSSNALTELASGSHPSGIQHVSFSPSQEPSRGRQRTPMSRSAYSRSSPPSPPPGYRRPRVQAAPPQYLAQPRSSEFRIQIGNMTELGDHGADVLDALRRPGGSSSRESTYQH